MQDCERGSLELAADTVVTLISKNRHATVSLDESHCAETFDEVDERRFEKTQTEYKEWAVDPVDILCSLFAADSVLSVH